MRLVCRTIFRCVLISTVLAGCAVAEKINLGGLNTPFKKTNLEQDMGDAERGKHIGIDQRFKEYIEKTNAPAKDAYNRAKIWAAGAYKFGGKSAIETDDPTATRFLARGFIESCHAFGSIRPYEVSFLIEFQAKENRVRILFDKILVTSMGQQSGKFKENVWDGLFDTNLPKTDKELAMVAENCLDPIRRQILTEIARSPGAKEW